MSYSIHLCRLQPLCQYQTYPYQMFPLYRLRQPSPTLVIGVKHWEPLPMPPRRRFPERKPPCTPTLVHLTRRIIINTISLAPMNRRRSIVFADRLSVRMLLFRKGAVAPFQTPFFDSPTKRKMGGAIPLGYSENFPFRILRIISVLSARQSFFAYAGSL